jgi:hypothetical protein
MKNVLLPFFILALALTACNDSDRNLSDETGDDINTATSFLRAALDGRFDKVKTYIIHDSLNLQDLEASARIYEKMGEEEKKLYRGASVHIHERKVVDSVTSIIVYSNTYRNTKDSLRMVKQDGKWLIDFKYIFKHKPDSLQ